MLPAGDQDEMEIQYYRPKHVELIEIINKIIIESYTYWTVHHLDI